MLRAQPGDRLVIRAHHTGETEHDGEIVEVLGGVLVVVVGAAGGPRFVVRWEDDGHISRLYPGPDAYVQRLGHEFSS